MKRPLSGNRRASCGPRTFVWALMALAPALAVAQNDAPTVEGGGGSTEALKSLTLEELMSVKVQTQSTVSRVTERIDDAPGNVYVYPREVIQQRGYRSLGDLLQSVPGFTVFHRDLEYVTSVRGLAANDNDKVTLLINGRLFNGAHEHSFLNGPINLDNVERVEVVVGPSSFFQQADTLAATINVITRNVEGVEMIGAIGNDLKYSGTVMAGHHWAVDKFLSFSFTTEEKEGFDAWSRDFRQNLAGRSLTGRLEQPSYFGVLNGQYGEWSAQFASRRSSWPELIINNGSPENDGLMVEEVHAFNLRNEHVWSGTLTSVLNLDAALREQTRMNQDGPPENALELSIHQSTYSGEVGIRYSGFSDQLIQAGMQLSYNDNFDTWYTYHNSEQDPAIVIPRTTLVGDNSTGVGFYVDDTATINDRLKLIAGFRMDYNDKLAGKKWHPGARAAIIYKATDNWTTKLIYNRSVRMPSDLEALNEVWGSNNLDTAPSFATASVPAAQPEILNTFEWQNIFYFGDIRLAASIYHQELEDFISWFQPHSNGGNFRGNGIELSLRAPLSDNATLWANAAWNDSTLNLFQPVLAPDGTVESHHAYTNPDGRIIGSAEYTANLGIDWRITDHLTFSPSIRYFTNQAALDHGRDEYITIRNRFYLDAGLTWDHVLDHELDLRLSCRNLLNNRDPVASQMNGDTYRPRGTEVVLAVETRF